MWQTLYRDDLGIDFVKAHEFPRASLITPYLRASRVTMRSGNVLCLVKGDQNSMLYSIWLPKDTAGGGLPGITYGSLEGKSALCPNRTLLPPGPLEIIGPDQSHLGRAEFRSRTALHTHDPAAFAYVLIDLIRSNMPMVDIVDWNHAR